MTKCENCFKTYEMWTEGKGAQLKFLVGCPDKHFILMEVSWNEIISDEIACALNTPEKKGLWDKLLLCVVNTCDYPRPPQVT